MPSSRSSRSSIASGDPFEIELRARRFDGVYRWFQSRGLPLRDTNGDIVRWYNLLIDIDERKRAEEALRESERKFRLLVGTIPAFVWRGTSEGDLDYLNERAVEYLDRTAQSLTGGGWIELVHPDHRDATCTTVAAFGHNRILIRRCLQDQARGRTVSMDSVHWRAFLRR